MVGIDMPGKTVGIIILLIAIAFILLIVTGSLSPTMANLLEKLKGLFHLAGIFIPAGKKE